MIRGGLSMLRWHCTSNERGEYFLPVTVDGQPEYRLASCSRVVLYPARCHAEGHPNLPYTECCPEGALILYLTDPEEALLYQVGREYDGAMRPCLPPAVRAWEGPR